MTRRELLAAGTAAIFGGLIPLPFGGGRKPLRMAVITDLHHGLAPDALDRFKTFVDAVQARPETQLVIQLGDFCHPLPSSGPFMDLWESMKLPKLHVLGNHDMDHGDKETTMRYWGMKARYGSFVFGGYRFVTLDLNHFRKDGKLVPYANGNYFTDASTFNLADPEQLDWLGKELRHSREPVILLSHQPLGFAEPNQSMPEEQVEVLKIVTDAAAANPKGRVILSLFGHLHVDRLEHHHDLPCLCVNSASYFWYQGMQKYTNPLYAFMGIGTDGVLHVEGVGGEFVEAPPAASDTVLGRSASIASRTVKCG